MIEDDNCQDDGQNETSAWLIERPANKNFPEMALACLRTLFTFQDFADGCLIRFSRKEDAERMLRGLKALPFAHVAYDTCKAVEHMWTDPMPKTTAPTSMYGEIPGEWPTDDEIRIREEAEGTSKFLKNMAKAVDNSQKAAEALVEAGPDFNFHVSAADLEQEILETTMAPGPTILEVDPPLEQRGPKFPVEEALRVANDAHKEHNKLLQSQVQFLQDELKAAKAKHSLDAADLLHLTKEAKDVPLC